ncbi:subtilase family protein [Paraburkholderia tropica]|uniref:Subtilase family protein n=1 Tax=Paraburkholderia tropica TaxID=92647 RepID=A0ABX5MFG1_9BURK|nr:subtilase family protein [Paraburkholderia tropica]PZW73083.1 subtilase family protein [Paraburkholderia tropica]
MSTGPLPLLVFPNPTPIRRETGTPIPPTLHIPGGPRQGQRLTPRFQALQDALEARRLELQPAVANDDPDLVVVFETVGTIKDFISTAQRIVGMEWLTGMLDVEFAPDEDFYHTDDHDRALKGKLFLVGTNRQALNELVRLWTRYQEDRSVNLGAGLSAWKQLFDHLRDVRFWGPEDRLDASLRHIWEERLAHDAQSIRFEVEAWCFQSRIKNEQAAEEVRAVVRAMNGRMLSERLIAEISYHGFLVDVPAAGVQLLLNDARSPLLMSERVMFLRPQGQSYSVGIDVEARFPDTPPPPTHSFGPPIVALLDGLPMENHRRLQGRVQIEDPDGWAADYQVHERLHGTTMASLIVWGDLDSGSMALPNPIYVRPILRPDGVLPLDGESREERTPDDRLLIDVIHEAVRRMFEQSPTVTPSAPTVKVINLSVGDGTRPFNGALSPWARLIDWLAHRYRVLFVVSTGNRADDLMLEVPRGTLSDATPAARESAAMSALLKADGHRRLISPAESINALTVGASYNDDANFAGVPTRYTLFPERGIAPYSSIGPGYRRSVKPDILLPGGRGLYGERPLSPPEATEVTGYWRTPRAPGQRTAVPGDAGDTAFTRGTSNAAALATRGAALAHSVIEELRAANAAVLPSHFDAVLIKALLAHGARWHDLGHPILTARPDVDHWHAQKRLVSRYIGYGTANISRALTCTEQRATLLGVGQLRNERALEFRVPLPEGLNARVVMRRLTVTLAWLSPVNPRHSHYRTARLWVDLPDDPLRLDRVDVEARQARLGTLQHEIFEGGGAVPIVADQDLVLRVNCLADAGPLTEPVDFALCVSLEVAEGIDVPIYQQIRERVQQRIAVAPAAS